MGETVTVTRPAPIGGNGKTQTLSCVPTPLTPDGARQMGLEGALDTADSMPHIFLFSGDADVRNNDKISYNGKRYNALMPTPTRLNGANAGLQVVGVIIA